MTDYGYMKNKIKQYEKDYENIKNMYEITGSIIRACKNLNMSKIHYYYICDKYNLPRIINKSKQNSNQSIIQKGGNLQKNKKISKITKKKELDELKKYNNIKLISNNDTNYSKNNNIMSDNNIIFTQNKNLNDNNKKNINEQKEKKHKQLCIKYINDIYNSKIVNSHQ
jgi:hypothetical protein